MEDQLFEIISITLDIAGKILLVGAAISVHEKVKKETKIDKKVLVEMSREKKIAISSIMLMVLAYLVKLYLILN